MNTSSPCKKDGSVKTTERKYADEHGARHRAVFREVSQGNSPSCYDIEHDGVLYPRLDKSLYDKLLAMGDQQLAHYFSES